MEKDLSYLVILYNVTELDNLIVPDELSLPTSYQGLFFVTREPQEK